jgi:hypothetical protein
MPTPVSQIQAPSPALTSFCCWCSLAVGRVVMCWLPLTQVALCARVVLLHSLRRPAVLHARRRDSGLERAGGASACPFRVERYAFSGAGRLRL